MSTKILMHENVMVDLETLGRRAGCKILSIGAVQFSAAGLGSQFYATVRLDDQHGLMEDKETLAWWAKQSPEARAAVFTVDSAKLPLNEALEAFNTFVARIGRGRVKVWGNGSDFDNAILYAAYAAASVAPGWEFWNSRCFRTLKGLVPGVPMVKTGTAHNALDDAISQAQHAVKLFKLAANAGVNL